MFSYDLDSVLTALRLFGPSAKTASADGTGVDVRPYVGNIKVVLDSAAGTGTDPELDVKIQDSADNVTFADVDGLAFTQVTDAAASLQSLAVDTRLVRRYIRAVATIGGETPSFTFAVSAVAQEQRQ